MSYLFLLVILDCVLVALLESGEGDIHFGRPPDLSAAQGHLGRVVKQPLLSRLLLVADLSTSSTLLGETPAIWMFWTSLSTNHNTTNGLHARAENIDKVHFRKTATNFNSYRLENHWVMFSFDNNLSEGLRWGVFSLQYGLWGLDIGKCLIMLSSQLASAWYE